MKIDALSAQRSSMQTLERDVAVHEVSRSDTDFGAELADQHAAFSDRQLQEIYTTVRKIDHKLEELAEKIRTGQTDAFDIVASHDAIRGMLVDLYM